MRELSEAEAQRGCPAIVVVEPDVFDEIERRMREPQKPTEAILRGAALLRQLYGKRVADAS